MDFTEDVLGDRDNGFPTFVDNHHKLSCYKDDQGNWRIHPQGNNKYWYLQQVHERWLLFVHNAPQILFQLREAESFIQRRLKTQAESDH